MNKQITVAVSGGVDSLMTAYLLKEQGFDVRGIHFSTGFEIGASKDIQKNKNPVFNIGEQLDIPIEIINLKKEFQEKVINYFTRTYKSGRTPNPCLVCNPEIKFGLLLDYAKKTGSAALATGHYARILRDNSGKCCLLKGVDSKKDQSYFLAFLSEKQLADALFPLGDRTKDEVKKLALEKGLNPVTSEESQDICFIKDISYSDFLLGQSKFKPSSGYIVDKEGNRLRKHDGIHNFTIGQRKGIDCPAKTAYYVMRIDPESNQVIVGSKSDLLHNSCRVSEINWINDSPGPCEEIEIQIRLRYRHKAVNSILELHNKNTSCTVEFENPQSSITPGQGAVFYKGDKVLGGGWIE